MKSASTTDIGLPRSFAYTALETMDADQHSVAIPECAHVYEPVGRAPFRGHVAELLLGPVHILRDQVSNPFGYEGAGWTGANVFFSFLPSSGLAFCHGRQIHQNIIVTYPPDHRYRTFCNGPIDCVAVSIREDALVDELSRLTGEGVPSLQHAHFVADSDCVDRFQHGIASLLSEVAVTPSLIEDCAWRQSAKDSVLGLLLEFVSFAYSEPQKLPPPTTRSYIVDKAIEYMLSNVACLPTELKDVCKALRVSPRTLRYSFEKVVGVSPGHYLLSLRLRRVRQELVEGSGVTGIHRVAQRHGFGHMGRFALFYRQAFGEKPSETCRRATGDSSSARGRTCAPRAR